MRGLVPGLDTSRELGGLLPALLQGDSFARRLTSALDEVLAPVISTLDNIDAYLDPMFAPSDFVDWLADWVGLALDENWSLPRRREMVAHMTELYRWRGTARGLRTLIALQAGVEPEIEESGGVSWSPVPGGELPGRSAPSLTVRVHLPNQNTVDLNRLDALIAAARPAHVPHHLEVVPA